MTQVDYKPFVDRMIDKYEGGYGWDRGDPGGPTKYGITCYELAEFRNEKMTSMAAWAPKVKAMPRSEAEEIFKTKYAHYLAFDDLPAGVDCCVMDYGVNSGYSRAARVACRIVGHPERTTITSAVVAKIKAMDSEKFINAMCDERLAFMKSIRGGSMWRTFGKGWARRVADLRKFSVALARGETPAEADKGLPAAPRAKATNQADNSSVLKQTGVVAMAAPVLTTMVPLWVVVLLVIAVVVIGLVAFKYQKDIAARLDALVVLPQQVTKTAPVAPAPAAPPVASPAPQPATSNGASAQPQAPTPVPPAAPPAPSSSSAPPGGHS